ncbi:hypothetical protein AA0119_g9353 [Alternaria tenuissima]|uniref:Uncharacterized protein n=1 Tax=Alternaria tenuissima TaxID=119927 RepID=A0AB37W7C6_9PLEO|nr:hypothetical protein AA0115_g9777 [Alternaria tenuissima]RYN94113.1 hypothetical protein AA0119_g9353 [Alternaria tenuissima]RYO10758.1 hypothetical protein AA0121_g10504 [Alternaria tenuissima]
MASPGKRQWVNSLGLRKRVMQYTQNTGSSLLSVSVEQKKEIDDERGE